MGAGEGGEVDIAGLADVAGAGEGQKVADGAVEAIGDAQGGLDLLMGGRGVVE